MKYLRLSYQNFNLRLSLQVFMRINNIFLSRDNLLHQKVKKLCHLFYQIHLSWLYKVINLPFHSNLEGLHSLSIINNIGQRKWKPHFLLKRYCVVYSEAGSWIARKIW